MGVFKKFGFFLNRPYSVQNTRRSVYFLLLENALTFFREANFVRPVGPFSEKESVQKSYIHQELRLCPLWSRKYEF